ncbi:MAG: TonB family protein [Pyrinomonadaceae bacterium]
MKKIIFVLSLFILFAGGAKAQAFENLSWVRLESDARDFSVVVPPNYQILHDDKGYGLGKGFNSRPGFKTVNLSGIRYITAFQNNASFLIESYKTDNLRDALDLFYGDKLPNQEFSGIPEVEGKMFIRSTEKFYLAEIIIGYKDRIYRILCGAKDANNETLKYVLSSVKFKEKSFLALKSTLDSQLKETATLISGLTETPFTVEKEEKDKPPVIDKSAEVKKEENKKGVVFLYRQPAKYTDSARKAMITGKVRLRVTFSEYGNVEKIVVLDSLPEGLTENAVKSARLIRFLPQEIDNKLTSATKVVEYSFLIY